MTILDIPRRIKLGKINQQFGAVTDYESWQLLAEKHDGISGASNWRKKEDSSLYNHAAIRERHDSLAKLLKEKNYSDLLFALNEGVHGCRRPGFPKSFDSFA